MVHSSESSTCLYEEGTAVELRVSATHTVVFLAEQSPRS
jgi:iron(III) transport system ATP-binding protein